MNEEQTIKYTTNNNNGLVLWFPVNSKLLYRHAFYLMSKGGILVNAGPLLPIPRLTLYRSDNTPHIRSGMNEENETDVSHKM
jgi:hypothetical protein